MPLHTCEMRWFLEGALPAEVERWFAQGQPPAAQPRRDDRYLILPGVADMGIKEREGRLEIKGRTAGLGDHVIAPEIEGSLERWCKWSYGTAVADRFAGHRTIVVGKERAQKHFSLEPGGAARQRKERRFPRRGFSIELTRISVAAKGHWSIGIEAAPDDASLPDDLLRVLSDVLGAFPLPLPRTSSRSYPEWLAQRASA